MTGDVWGEVGSAVFPFLTGEGGSSAPWWLVLGIGVVVAALVLWAVLQGGAR